MTLLQRTRFSDWLKNLAGWRGTSPLDLGELLQPVLDLNAWDPYLDDGTCFFTSLSQSNAAVAAQFASIGAQLNPSAKPGSRAIIDGWYLRPVAAGQNFNVGLAQAPAAGQATNPSQVQNNFLTGRSAAVDQSSTFQAVITTSRNAAASVFSLVGGTTQNTFEVGANVQHSALGFALGFPRYVLTPGWGFWMEAGAVNLGISGFCWGRFLGDQT